MPTPILPKFSAPIPLTITIASLANSSGGSGRQSTIYDNTTTRFQRATVFLKTKLGATPTVGYLGLYLIRDDGSATPLRDDGAGATDAGINLLNSYQFGSLVTKPSPATGDVLTNSFPVENPGIKFAIAVLNFTGVALDATAGNHVLEFVGEYPEIQN